MVLSFEGDTVNTEELWSLMKESNGDLIDRLIKELQMYGYITKDFEIVEQPKDMGRI